MADRLQQSSLLCLQTDMKGGGRRRLVERDGARTRCQGESDGDLRPTRKGDGQKAEPRVGVAAPCSHFTDGPNCASVPPAPGRSARFDRATRSSSVPAPTRLNSGSSETVADATSKPLHAFFFFFSTAKPSHPPPQHLPYASRTLI